MSNELKMRIAAGKANVNGGLAIPSGFSAEAVAQCGWDSVTIIGKVLRGGWANSDRPISGKSA